MEYALFSDKNNKDVAMVSAYPGYFIGSSSDTKQKEACIRFLKYMLSEKVQTKIWKKTGQIPSNPNVNIADLSGLNDVIYEAYAKYMISMGKAYPCFATAEELDEMRKTQEAAKVRPG